MPVTAEITTQYDTTTVPVLNWTGAWSSATAYNPGDAVSLGGSSYVCVTANTNSPPPNANWNTLAQQGATGATGATGPTGPTGPQGATGAQGPIGNTGPQGPIGNTGPTGPTGATGATGAPGPVVTWRGAWSSSTSYVTNDAVSFGGSSYLASAPSNNSPPPGAAWALMAQAGATGPVGATGPQGATGAIGPAGPTGATGAQGATGAVGPIGATGTTGAAGPQGLQGPAGPTGAQGVAGPTGPLGPAGPTGSAGPAGPAGPQGPAGLGLNIKGTVTTYSALPTSNAVNDAWVTSDTGILWTWNGSAWVNTGLVRGPAGPTGPQGIQGATGPAGANGPTGPQGLQGAPGVQGAQGPQGAQGVPGDPFGTPALGIGVVAHWRPTRSTFDRYGLCKPLVLLEVLDQTNLIVNGVVLGSRDGPVMLYDHIPSGTGDGQWHYIANCPYAMGPASTQALAFIPSTNGVAV